MNRFLCQQFFTSFIPESIKKFRRPLFLWALIGGTRIKFFCLFAKMGIQGIAIFFFRRPVGYRYIGFCFINCRCGGDFTITDGGGVWIQLPVIRPLSQLGKAYIEYGPTSSLVLSIRLLESKNSSENSVYNKIERSIHIFNIIYPKMPFSDQRGKTGMSKRNTRSSRNSFIEACSCFMSYGFWNVLGLVFRSLFLFSDSMAIPPFLMRRICGH